MGPPSSRGRGRGHGQSPGRIRLPTCPPTGLGAEIAKLNGRTMGKVVAEDRRSWHLGDGNAVRKAAEGRKWRWVATLADATTDDCPTDEGRSPSRRGRSSAASSSEMACLPPAAGQLAFPDWAIVAVSNWLQLAPALRLTMACRTWAGLLEGHVPLPLPAPQMDELLMFCLLEVLVRFDDERLPLPMSAVYGEMRMAARRATLSSHVRERLESMLASERPHHNCWEADLKQSTFKTLDRFAKKFDGYRSDARHTEDPVEQMRQGKRLVETVRQRWRKQIHHTPNTRTCIELMLTRVNRSHPLFIEHEQWAAEVAGPDADSLGA